MEIGVEPVNRKKIWVTDAEGALGRGMVTTSRCLYTNALKVLQKEEDLWIALAQLEMLYGTADALDEVLSKVFLLLLKYKLIETISGIDRNFH